MKRFEQLWPLMNLNKILCPSKIFVNSTEAFDCYRSLTHTHTTICLLSLSKQISLVCSLIQYSKFLNKIYIQTHRESSASGRGGSSNISRSFFFGLDWPRISSSTWPTAFCFNRFFNSCCLNFSEAWADLLFWFCRAAWKKGFLY